MLRPKTPEPTMRMLEGMFCVEDDMVMKQDRRGRRRPETEEWLRGGNVEDGLEMDIKKKRGRLSCLQIIYTVYFITDLIHVDLFVFG